MKLNDAKTSEFLTQWAEAGKYLEDGLDDILHYANGRIDGLPAPFTLESCIALTDDEQMAMFEQFGLAKYYPDISHERRAWMLWMQNLLWRKLGTPKALETLCMYLFDDVTVHLEVKDNEAWDSLGNLTDEDLLDVFDAELTIDSLNLPSEMLERVKANIIRFVRNQEWMRAFVFLFEAMDTTTGVSITDGERYARDYLIDLYADGSLPIDIRLVTSNNIGVSRDFSVTPKVGQYDFLLDFEDWEPSTGYDTQYNITKDGFTIKAVGRVIDPYTYPGTHPDVYPINGYRSFALNGGQSYNNYIIISGLQGVGRVTMKWAPWVRYPNLHEPNGDMGTVLLVSDGTTTLRFPLLYNEPDGSISIKFNNPLAQRILISPVQTTQRNARIRIDDIRF